MGFEIYLADVEGSMTTNTILTLGDLIKEDPILMLRNEQLTTIEIQNGILPKLVIGDIFYKVNSFIIIVAYNNVSLPKPANYNWGLYLKNILTILDIKRDLEIRFYMTNTKNTLREIQTLHAQHEIQRMLLDDLTNHYSHIQVV